MEQIIVETFTPGEGKNDGFAALLEMCHAPMYPNEQPNQPYAIMMKRRISGEYQEPCCDNYYIAYTNKTCLSRLWTGWGRHADAIGNFGHFLTLPECRGMGLGRKVLQLWYNDITTRADAPLALFCSAEPEIAEIYRPYGFCEIDPNERGGPLYMPLGGSPQSFADFCKLYYQPSNTLVHKKADVGYRHEIDCLLRFALKMEGISFPIDGIYSLENCLILSPDRVGMFFSEDGHCVGWSYDGKTRIHPLYETATIVQNEKGL